MARCAIWLPWLLTIFMVIVSILLKTTYQLLKHQKYAISESQNLQFRWIPIRAGNQDDASSRFYVEFQCKLGGHYRYTHTNFHAKIKLRIPVYIILNRTRESTQNEHQSMQLLKSLAKTALYCRLEHPVAACQRYTHWHIDSESNVKSTYSEY